MLLLALSAATASLAHPPQQVGTAEGDKQHQRSAPTPTAPQQPTSDSGQQRGTCAGTSRPERPCEAVSAAADERQAEDADAQWTLGWWNIGAGLLTAMIAGVAAWFARDAAAAARKSATAFVAAEDAHLDVQFIDGAVTESFADGKKVGEWYGLDIRVTNIGRSTANLHWYCIPETEQTYPLNKILKRDEECVLPMGIDLGKIGAFELNIGYSSPIRQNAKLIVRGTVFKHLKPHARARGQVVSTRIEGDVE